MYSSEYFVKNYLKEIDMATAVNAAGALGALGGVGVGVAQLVGPSIAKAAQNLKYDMTSCDKLVDPNDRDQCDIRSLSKAISKLRVQYATASKKKDQASMIKLDNMIKKYQSQISKLEEDLAYRKTQAGVQ